MRIKAHQILLALLVAAGCSTETIGGGESLLLINAGHLPTDPWVSVGGSVPAWAGNVRVKINGRYLATGGPNNGYSYLEISGGYHSEVAAPLDASTTTAEIELVGQDGRTLLHTAPLSLSDPGGLFLWVHDSPSGLVGEVPDPTVDDDPETAEIRTVNVSSGDRVELYRCVGVVGCPGCVTTPNGASVPFSFDDCSLLATVGPGERWTDKVAVTHVDDPPAPGSACVGAHLEGQPIGPVCYVELNTPALAFRDLTYLFLDGLTPTLELNGAGPPALLPGTDFYQPAP